MICEFVKDIFHCYYYLPHPVKGYKVQQNCSRSILYISLLILDLQRERAGKTFPNKERNFSDNWTMKNFHFHLTNSSIFQPLIFWLLPCLSLQSERGYRTMQSSRFLKGQKRQGKTGNDCHQVEKYKTARYACVSLLFPCVTLRKQAKQLSLHHSKNQLQLFTICLTISKAYFKLHVFCLRKLVVLIFK